MSIYLNKAAHTKKANDKLVIKGVNILNMQRVPIKMNNLTKMGKGLLQKIHKRITMWPIKNIFSLTHKKELGQERQIRK